MYSVCGSDDDPNTPVHSVTDTNASRLQEDLLKSNGRFSSPRMAITSYPTPPVQICNTFRLLLRNGSNIAFADPFAVDWLPPESVLNSASKALHVEENPDACAIEFDGLGHFDVQSLRVLQNYFAFKAVAKKALFEEKWLLEETHGVSPSERLHLLNTVLYLSPRNGLVSKSHGIEISVDDLTTLCGERYLNDKVIDYLLNLFEERANSAAGKTICLSLSTFLAPEQMSEGAMKMLHRVSLTSDISNLEIMLLPCNIEGNHWGLIVFDLSVQKIFYDDGFHMEPLSMYLKVLQTFFENTCCERFNTSKWKALSLEKFGMPDQPHSGTGSTSCGIGVLLAARDFSQGVRTFGWTFQEAPHYRKRFMLDITHDKP